MLVFDQLPDEIKKLAKDKLGYIDIFLIRANNNKYTIVQWVEWLKYKNIYNDDTENLLFPLIFGEKESE